MICFLEGLSGTGKTYLIDRLLEKNPDWIRFKGAGAINIGMQGRWQDYNFWMHNNIERLDQINNYKKVILWDRGLTDSAYSEDEDYRKEILRVSKSHIKKCALFITTTEKEWPLLAQKRNSKEGNDFKTHFDKYMNVIKSFPSKQIVIEAPDFHIESKHIDEVINFINGRMKI
jgi:hypothetical protein